MTEQHSDRKQAELTDATPDADLGLRLAVLTAARCSQQRSGSLFSPEIGSLHSLMPDEESDRESSEPSSVNPAQILSFHYPGLSI